MPHSLSMYPITTARLRLIPGSSDVLDADMAFLLTGNDAALRFLLNTAAVGEWPPIGGEHDINALEFFRSQIVQFPFSEEWLAYYVCLGKELVGSAGFFGPPVDGEVEIGYSICSTHRRRGIASEAIEGLLNKARQFGALSARARTSPENVASTDLLLKAGFTEDVSDDTHRVFRRVL